MTTSGVTQENVTAHSYRSASSLWSYYGTLIQKCIFIMKSLW